MPRWTRQHLQQWMPAAGIVMTVACTLALTAVGHPDSTESMGAVGVAFGVLLKSGGIACLYLLAAFGIGCLPARLAGADLWVQMPLGIGVMLWLSHMLGVLGFLSGARGWAVAWGVVVAGLLILAGQVARGNLRPERWVVPSPWILLGVPGLAIMLGAACNPPGALWPGEARGYDALSYHLELPKEWLMPGTGAIKPLEHNVYSYLPSAMEAAYVHIGAMTGGGSADGGEFIAGDGTGVIACQMLHAGLGMLTALLIGRIVWVFSIREAAGTLPDGADTRLAGLCASVGVACAISVPWVMVVGSLPYNELAMTAMLAGALVVAAMPDWGTWARGAAVGFLVGMACSTKPTAAFLGAPMVGLVLLGMNGRRTWGALLIAGCIGGLAAVAPWLIRNWVASGNPVFPFAAGVLGSDGWSDEQVRRYAGAHRFTGGIWERLSVLVSRDRGVLHPQWAWLFPGGVLGLAGAAWRRSLRRGALLLLAGVGVQVLAWLWLTHLQSRFLIPMVVPLCVGVGLGVRAIGGWRHSQLARRRAGGVESVADGSPDGPRNLWVAVLGCMASLSLAADSCLLYLGQRSGHPNELLIAGVPALTGEAYAIEFARATPADRAMFLARVGSAAVYTNFVLEPGDMVYLLGSAAPLYYLGGRAGPGAILYHTTWDRSPLGDAVREHPDDPRLWTEAVEAWMAGRGLNRAATVLGRAFVLVDVDELARLSLVDHWSDPSVTPAVVERWMKQEGSMVRAWRVGSGGTYLFRLLTGADKGKQ